MDTVHDRVFVFQCCLWYGLLRCLCYMGITLETIVGVIFVVEIFCGERQVCCGCIFAFFLDGLDATVFLSVVRLVLESSKWLPRVLAKI